MRTVPLAAGFPFLLLFFLQLVQCCNDRYGDFCDTAEEEAAGLVAVLDKEPLLPFDRLRRSPDEQLPQPQPYRRNERQMSAQTSSILDRLFNLGYDRQIRPQLGLRPLEVTVNMVIRSMGPVDEQKATVSFDCYFRQYWKDDRLQYNGTRLKELPMNWQFLYKIWRPDTYIVNGKQSYLHKMTVPNRFIRIAPDGMISYSQRLTVKSRCLMDLRKFPLDSQTCPLEIGSFGHESQDIMYKWHANPLSMEKLGLAQYHLVDWSMSQFMGVRNQHGARNLSTVSLSFQFERQQGFFLLQIYIPLTLIVMCSWVTFWLAKTEKGSEIPARTSLGASSVLSIVTIGFGGKSKPQVAYATALDVFIILCFINVFASLVEYAFINFLDTLVRRLKRKDNDNRLVRLMAQHAVMGDRLPTLPPKRQESVMDTDGIEAADDGCDDEDDEGGGGGDENCGGGGENGHGDEEEEPTPPPSAARRSTGIFRFARKRQRRRRHSSRIEGGGGGEHETDDEDANDDDDRLMSRLADSVISFFSRFRCCFSIREMEAYRRPHAFFARVDAISRKLFPLTFMVLNLFYWAGYMYIF